MATRPADRRRLVLVGITTPLGAEVRRRLSAARLPFDDVVVAEFEPDDEEGARRLSEFAGEALLVVPVAEAGFDRADVAVLCGDPDQVESVLGPASGAGLCVDVSGASRSRSDVPWMGGTELPPDARMVAAPQAVSITLATILKPLVHDGLVRASHGTVLLPASSLGEKAAEELYQQTLGLLSFAELPRERLAHQLAFNVLPWEDPDRPGSRTLSCDLAAEVRFLVGDPKLECDMQLLLAPTFHGYGYSLRLWTDQSPAEGGIADRLRDAGLHVALEGGAPASPVEALEHGERGLISRIHRVGENSVWIWAVADSLGAGAAQNVVEIVRQRANGFAPGA